MNVHIDQGSRGLTAQAPKAVGDIHKVDIDCEYLLVKLHRRFGVADRLMRQPEVVINMPTRSSSTSQGASSPRVRDWSAASGSCFLQECLAEHFIGRKMV